MSSSERYYFAVQQEWADWGARASWEYRQSLKPQFRCRARLVTEPQPKRKQAVYKRSAPAAWQQYQERLNSY